MNTKKTVLNSMIAIATALSGAQGNAQSSPKAPPYPMPPRGPDIEALAGNCGIGPFPQTTKAGHYNQFCDDLTDAEKCLALIKAHMSSVGVMKPANYAKDKAEYCVEHFRDELLKP